MQAEPWPGVSAVVSLHGGRGGKRQWRLRFVPACTASGCFPGIKNYTYELRFLRNWHAHVHECKERQAGHAGMEGCP